MNQNDNSNYYMDIKKKLMKDSDKAGKFARQAGYYAIFRAFGAGFTHFGEMKIDII